MSNIFCILTGRQQVMFSVVSVCQREGAPAALYRAPTAKKCSNLFNLDLTVQGPPDMIKLVQLGPHLTTPYPTPDPQTFKFVGYEARMVSIWAVDILLEWFFVNIDDSNLIVSWRGQQRPKVLLAQKDMLWQNICISNNKKKIICNNFPTKTMHRNEYSVQKDPQNLGGKTAMQTV